MVVVVIGTGVRLTACSEVQLGRTELTRGLIYWIRFCPNHHCEVQLTIWYHLKVTFGWSVTFLECTFHQILCAQNHLYSECLLRQRGLSNSYESLYIEGLAVGTAPAWECEQFLCEIDSLLTHCSLLTAQEFSSGKLSWPAGQSIKFASDQYQHIARFNWRS